MGSEIGHQNMVGIFVVLEERPLPSFDRVLGNGTADHSQAVRTLPGVGLVTELSHLPPRAQFPKLAIAGPPLDRGVLLGHHGVATAAGIEEFHKPSAEASTSARTQTRDPAREEGTLSKQRWTKATPPVAVTAWPGRREPCQNSCQ